jgi:hypothetical protein
LCYYPGATLTESKFREVQVLLAEAEARVLAMREIFNKKRSVSFCVGYGSRTDHIFSSEDTKGLKHKRGASDANSAGPREQKRKAVIDLTEESAGDSAKTPIDLTRSAVKKLMAKGVVTNAHK